MYSSSTALERTHKINAKNLKLFLVVSELWQLFTMRCYGKTKIRSTAA